MSTFVDISFSLSLVTHSSEPAKEGIWWWGIHPPIHPPIHSIVIFILFKRKRMLSSPIRTRRRAAVNDHRRTRRPWSFALFFFLSLILFMSFDLLIWFPLTFSWLYQPMFQRINPETKLSLLSRTRVTTSAVVTWMLMAFVLTYCLQKYWRQPPTEKAVPPSSSLWWSHGVLQDAFVLGLCTFGIYNFTNYASLSRYRLQTAVIDTMWGSCAFPLTGWCAMFLWYHGRRPLYSPYRWRMIDGL